MPLSHCVKGSHISPTSGYVPACRITQKSDETTCLGTHKAGFGGLYFSEYAFGRILTHNQIFDRHITAYEKVIEAYSQIVQNLPRFDRLGHAFRDQPEFQGILADVYTDILDFHLEVHKIARRSGKGAESKYYEVFADKSVICRLETPLRFLLEGL